MDCTLFEVRGHPARMVVEHIIRRISDFTKGAPQSDDITCLAIVRNVR
jgi:serine phosphatase RsbU (regulator of sigma subunit)